MRAGVGLWVLAALLGASTGWADSWVVDGDARGPVKEKSTVWSLGLMGEVQETIVPGSNGIPSSAAVVGYVGGVVAPVQDDLIELDGRLDRAEIDILNNYLFDATANAVGNYPLLWGFADSFTDIAFISVMSNMVHDAENELMRANLGVQGGDTAHYKMNDDAANTTVSDATGTYDAEFQGDNTADVTGSGKVNAALDFEPNDDGHIELPNSLFAELKTTMVGSMAVWVQPETWSTYNAVIGLQGPGCGENCGIMLTREPAFGSPYAVYFQVYANCGVGGGPCNAYYDLGYDWSSEWHHVALVQTGAGGLQGYLDGVNITDDVTEWDGSMASCTNWFYGSVNSSGMRIGTDGNGSDFDGKIDDVRYSMEVWSDADVLAIYNEGNGTESAFGAGVTNTVAVLVTSNRVWATGSSEAYVSLQVEVPQAEVTNVLIAVANTDPPSWISVPFGVDAVLPDGILACSGATNLPTAGTNLTVRVTVTNSFEGVKLHGIGYGRR